MKVKYCSFILFMNLLVGVNGADIKDFFDPVFSVEQQLQKLTGFNKVHTLPTKQLA